MEIRPLEKKIAVLNVNGIEEKVKICDCRKRAMNHENVYKESKSRYKVMEIRVQVEEEQVGSVRVVDAVAVVSLCAPLLPWRVAPVPLASLA